MRITTENGSGSRYIFISLLLMIACLFLSRAALSISMMLFLALTLIHRGIGEQLKHFVGNRLLLSLSFLFLVPFVSGLWSQDLDEWSQIVRIKLPLLFFPLAFAGSWQLLEKQWRVVMYVFILLIFLGSCWSLFQYSQNMQGFHEGYLRSQVITTPMENDHVRFSWLVTVAFMCCTWLSGHAKEKAVRIASVLAGVFFMAYLHILSARTGLMALYIFLFLFAIWLVVRGRRYGVAMALVAVMVVLPFLAWLALPTFQNRVKYFLYDISHVRSHTFLPGSNDGVRMASIRGGWAVLQQHPWGAGAGDLRTEMDAWYEHNVPALLEKERFLPCNEWLMYGGFAGWPGVLLFTLIMVVPFLHVPARDSIYWVSLNAIATFSFVFDMGIEAQFGTFMYPFTLLWWWKWLNQKQETHA